MHAAGSAEAPVAQRTLVRFLSGMDSHVTVQQRGRVERPVAHVAYVRLMSVVLSPVCQQTAKLGKPPAADAAFERFLTGMRPRVNSQPLVGAEPLSAFGAPVFFAVYVPMQSQVAVIGKLLTALTTGKQLASVMRFHVDSQNCFIHKSFLTHRTHAWPRLINMLMLRYIAMFGFNAISCIIHTTRHTMHHCK